MGPIHTDLCVLHVTYHGFDMGLPCRSSSTKASSCCSINDSLAYAVSSHRHSCNRSLPCSILTNIEHQASEAARKLKDTTSLCYLHKISPLTCSYATSSITMRRGRSYCKPRTWVSMTTRPAMRTTQIPCGTAMDHLDIINADEAEEGPSDGRGTGPRRGYILSLTLVCTRQLHI